MTAAVYGKLTSSFGSWPSLGNANALQMRGICLLGGEGVSYPRSASLVVHRTGGDSVRRNQKGLDADPFRSALRRLHAVVSRMARLTGEDGERSGCGSGCAAAPPHRDRRRMPLTSNDYVGDPGDQCKGKLGFRSKAAAKRKLARTKTTRGPRDNLRVYRCPHCHGFHIGTKPGKE